MSRSEEPGSLREWLVFFFEGPPSLVFLLLKVVFVLGVLVWVVVEAIAAWLEGRPRRRFPGDRR